MAVSTSQIITPCVTSPFIALPIDSGARSCNTNNTLFSIKYPDIKCEYTQTVYSFFFHLLFNYLFPLSTLLQAARLVSVSNISAVKEEERNFFCILVVILLHLGYLSVNPLLATHN